MADMFKTTEDEWDTRFMTLASYIASWSKDPTSKVGSILVNRDKQIIMQGYNGLPNFMSDCSNILGNKELKNAYVLHAEENVLSKVAGDLMDWTLYCTKPPCFNCALKIANRKVKRVVIPNLNHSSSWYENQLKALEVLNLAQVFISFKEVEQKW